MIAEKGDGWFLAPSLITFLNSVDKAFPNRDHSSDGSIGDASHAARVSEHNPCWNCTGYQHGIVRAIDVDIDGRRAGRDLRTEILNSTIGHRAVWYVISNRKIYSRTNDWIPESYTGANPHEHHVHISIQKTEAAAKDKTLLLKAPKPPVEEDMPLNDTDKAFITQAVEKAAEKASHRWALWGQLYEIETTDDVIAAQRAFDLAIDAGKSPEQAQLEAAKRLSAIRDALKKSQAQL